MSFKFVEDHVELEIPRMFECFTTLIADDNSACVGVLLVLNTRRVVGKCLPTVRADVGPLSCVAPQVDLHPVPRLEDLVTVRAGEPHIAVHGVDVVPQVARSGELLAAVLAYHGVSPVRSRPCHHSGLLLDVVI